MDNLKKLFTGPKIIFTILGIIILAEVIYAVKVLTPTAPPPSPAPIRQAVVRLTAGEISITSPKTTYKVNEEIPVSISIDTGGRLIDGVDVIARFDPKVLTATSGAVVRGQIFDEYPLISLDTVKGLISVSGVNIAKGGFGGTGQFAMVKFKARSSGRASVVIDFRKDLTTDSNLVEVGTSKDILEIVNNLELSIQ